MRVQHNVPLTKFGRKDTPKKGWNTKYTNFPIDRLEVGYSFNTNILYEYGKTITIKNRCRIEARKLGVKMTFSVRKWRDTIRVWRIK